MGDDAAAPAAASAQTTLSRKTRTAAVFAHPAPTKRTKSQAAPTGRTSAQADTQSSSSSSSSDKQEQAKDDAVVKRDRSYHTTPDRPKGGPRCTSGGLYVSATDIIRDALGL